MIDIATLKEYINVLEESGLQAIELSDGNDSIRLEKPAAAAAAAAAEPGACVGSNPGGGSPNGMRSMIVR